LSQKQHKGEQIKDFVFSSCGSFSSKDFQESESTWTNANRQFRGLAF